MALKALQKKFSFYGLSWVGIFLQWRMDVKKTYRTLWLDLVDDSVLQKEIKTRMQQKIEELNTKYKK